MHPRLLPKSRKCAINLTAVGAAAALFASGCGKFGYDPAALEDDGPVDAGHDGWGGPRWGGGGHDAVWSWDGGWGQDPMEAGVCNKVANAHVIVSEMNVASAFPPAGGGAIGDGRYYLVKRELFTGSGGASGPTGHTYREAIELTKTPGAELNPWQLLVQR